jgi:PAS domain S-box-containing protein
MLLDNCIKNKSTPMLKIQQVKNKRSAAADDILLRKAFNNSMEASFLTTVDTGQIIIVNRAACKLLGYSKKELLKKTRAAVFDIKESSFKKMLRQRTAAGHSRAYVTVVKKTGKLIPCQVTSAVFKDEAGIKISVNTIEDMSSNILVQKNIDAKKEKIVARNIMTVQLKCEAVLEDRLKIETKLKEKQIAEAVEDAKEAERSDIGKELHDNINQLLGASKLYLDLAKSDESNSKMFLKRSSEYTRMAIEEIRMLTKGMSTNTIKHLGLCAAIENIAEATMEMSPVNIVCVIKTFKEKSLNYECKLNIFRIIQEQINNILKHAKATKIIIGLLQTKNNLSLSVSDNGIGFDETKKRKGIGIANIQSRAALYKGVARFITQPGQGCVLSVNFPFAKAS